MLDYVYVSRPKSSVINVLITVVLGYQLECLTLSLVLRVFVCSLSLVDSLGALLVPFPDRRAEILILSQFFRIVRHLFFTAIPLTV